MIGTSNSADINAGDIVLIGRDIFVEGTLAFSKGEYCSVVKIDPHPAQPLQKYVVFSQLMGDYFLLSDADFIRPDISPIPVEPQAVEHLSVERPVALAVLVGAGMMCLAAFLPFYYIMGNPARGPLPIFVSAAGGIVIGFRAVEVLGFFERLPERKSTRIWAVAISIIAVAGSVYFFKSPIRQGYASYSMGIGAYLLLFGAVVALAGSIMLLLGPRYMSSVAGRCPHCAGPTKPGDVKCPWCGGDLPRPSSYV